MSDPILLDGPAIVAARGPRNAVDPTRPYAHFVEQEPTAEGVVEDVATVFIVNRECPFRCLMCDLWKNTTTDRVPDGVVADQVEWALGELRFAPHVKLYNSGSFFDQQAIPVGDWPRIARLMDQRRTLIVECHPRLVNHRCIEFSDLLGPVRLQLAMGLETVDPTVLPKLNKQMTLDGYRRAVEFLLQQGLDVRAFILLRPPYQTEEQGVYWANRSIDFAFSIGVECCVIIPVRAGNGIMERLEKRGYYTPPSLRSLEAVLEYGLNLGRGRVLADLWDVARFSDCCDCKSKRAERLQGMNRSQSLSDPVRCPCAG